MATDNRATDLLQQADAAKCAGDLTGFVSSVLESVLETARLRFISDSEMSDESRFTKFLEEEWPAFRTSIPSNERRRFGGTMRSVPSIFYHLQQEYTVKIPQQRTPLSLLRSSGTPCWFEPDDQGVTLEESWFDAMAVIVRHAPENCVGSSGDAPDSVVAWNLFGMSNVSHDSTLSSYMIVRAGRIEGARQTRLNLLEQVQLTESGSLPKAYLPDDLDELAYQIVNLRLLCQLYNQNMRTLYKPASVCLRTLLLRVSNIDALALKLGSPVLPELLVKKSTTSPGHFTAPSRLCFNDQIHLAAGAGFQNVNIMGGATGRVRIGDPFTEKLIPLSEWLNQPFLRHGKTLEDFIRTVVHKDGGAHYEAGNSEVSSLELGASFHWPLTIKIGEVVAASLWSQFEATNPGYKLRLP